MPQRNKIPMLALGMFSASIVLAVVLVLAAPPTADDVKQGTDAIEAFRTCINDTIKTRRDAGETADIADTVQCLPAKCTVTLTMSDRSAQKACFSGGPANCQLPRVILKCPGPPQFEPSYLLCPTGSAGADNVVGSNRVEVGVTVGKITRNDMERDVMVMADIPVPPGTEGNIMDVLSVVDDSKACNECHRNGNPGVAREFPQLSERIEVFGTFRGTALAPLVLSTDDPQVKEQIKDVQLRGGLKKQTLAETCRCIDRALMDPGDAGDDKFFNDPEQAVVVQKLCRALEDYQHTRGICGTDDCAPPSGPECTDLGPPCNPLNGEIVTAATGYSCQLVDEDVFQCLANTVCGGYALRGGGKFLVNRAVSTLRLDFSGMTSMEKAHTFIDFLATGNLSAYNYPTRTRIEAVTFSSLEGTVSGHDFVATGKGTALVNGVPTNIQFNATQTGSVLTFEIRHADTGVFLGGGTGEAGRSAMELAIGAP